MNYKRGINWCSAYQIKSLGLTNGSCATFDVTIGVIKVGSKVNLTHKRDGPKAKQNQK